MQKLYRCVITLILAMVPVFAGAVDEAVPRITKEELKAKIGNGEGVVVLDVRAKGSYEGSNIKIKGAIRIAPEEIEARYKELPQDREIVAYCT